MSPLPKNDKQIDITQIAQALGVSKTTVSRAISGNGRISTATRQRVLDYVKEHNYTPSMMARGLVKRCSYNISLVISTQFSDFELPFLRKVMRSVYQVAGDSDYDVLLTLVGDCTLATDAMSYGGEGTFVGVVKDNYDYPFANVRDLFESDDFTIANLECDLTDVAVVSDKMFAFRGPTAYTNILTGSSVEFVSYANNHTYDYGY